MVEIPHIVACVECRLYWDGDSESTRCRNGNHEHRVFEAHRHLDPVVLPGGTRLTAASFDPAGPYVRARVPDYGLYLELRWQPSWDHGHIDWPDFGIPADGDAVLACVMYQPPWPGAVLGRAAGADGGPAAPQPPLLWQAAQLGNTSDRAQSDRARYSTASSASRRTG